MGFRGVFVNMKWNSLETFSLESATGNSNVYANGRQSIKLRLAIKAIDINNDHVALSESERLSITLVNYHGGQPLKYRDPNDTSPLDTTHGRWDWSIANIGEYHFYPSSGPRALSVEPSVQSTVSASADYVDLYVRTVDLNPLTMAVEITRDDGEKFYSRLSQDGSFQVRPERPTAYRTSDYRLEEIILPEIRRPSSSAGLTMRFCYRLELVGTGRNLEFRSIEALPGGLHGNVGGGFELEAAEMVGYARPGESHINYLFNISYLPTTLEVNPGPGEIYLVRAHVFAGQGRYFGVLRGRRPVAMSVIKAIDEYGNEHPLRLRFKNGQTRGGELEFI